LATDDQLLHEVEALFIVCGEDDGRDPGVVEGVEAHHKCIAEDADQHRIQHRDGEDPVNGDDRLVGQRLPGWTGLGAGAEGSTAGAANGYSSSCSLVRVPQSRIHGAEREGVMNSELAMDHAM